MALAFPGKQVPDEATIGRWKRKARPGERVPRPTIDNVYMLARALGVPPEWLAFNIGEMGPGAVKLPKRKLRRPISELTDDTRDDRKTG